MINRSCRYWIQQTNCQSWYTFVWFGFILSYPPTLFYQLLYSSVVTTADFLRQGPGFESILTFFFFELAVDQR